jgi:2-methylcitrate dehydratase PrpD
MTTPETGLTSYVARFVQGSALEDLPDTVIERSICSILDGFGLALAGTVSHPGRLVEQYLRTLGVLNDRGATVIGRPYKSHARFASFSNGVSIHADDYDDTQLAVAPDRVYGLLTHPTAPVLPSALAMAERAGCSGADLLLAYNLGVEVECKVAEAINPRHYQSGFHSTGTCGTLGSAASAARLTNLDVEATARALSIAASQAAGLRENFGTMTKPFHAGRAAEAGVIAADLAGLGWSAATEILAAPRGFFAAAGGGYDESAIRDRLGAPWTFDRPGISIKPHPSGSLTHPAMTEMLRLIEDHHLRERGVVKVTVGTNTNMPNALIHHRPHNELEAKFSMEFCVAILLVEGRAGLGEFNDATVNREDVQEMIRRVDFVVDPEAEAAGYDKMTSIITVETTDGEVVRGRADFGKGSPDNPMSFEEVAQKFRGCADFAGWDSARADRIVSLVADIDHLADLRELSDCLSLQSS